MLIWRGNKLVQLLLALLLLLASSLPFLTGLFTMPHALRLLLLLVWPVLCAVVPFALVRTDTPWVVALLFYVGFFLVPLCVFLTPAGLRLLWPWPVLYTVLAVCSLPLAYLFAARSERRQDRDSLYR